MKIKYLEEEFKGRGAVNIFNYKRIYQSDNVSAYKKTAIEGGYSSIEVFERRFSKPYYEQNGDDMFDLVESFPSDAVFGVSAFECDSFCDAKLVILKLEKRCNLRKMSNK